MLSQHPYDPPDLPLTATLVRLYGLWREQRRLALSGFGYAVAFTGLSLAIPWLVQQAIDEAIDGPHTDRLVPYLLAIVAVATIRFWVNYQRRYASARVGIAVEARLRGLMYDGYLRFPRGFYDEHATGEVISRATNDIYPVRYFVGWGVIQGMQSALMLVGAAALLLTVDPHLALYAAAVMPLIALVTWVFGSKVHPVSRNVQARKGHLTEATDEAVVGIEMVQAFGREDDVRGRFGERANGVRTETMRQATVEARYLPGLSFLPTLAIATVLWLGGRESIRGNLTIGEFTLFVTLLLQLAWPLEALGWIVNLGQRATAAAGRCFSWLEAIGPLDEPDTPDALPEGPLTVTFEDVCFAFPDGEPVLNGVSFDVAPGEIVAVCGGTGAGKTSLLGLLPRFYDATAGRVLVGGVDTRRLTVTELRRTVAIVTQRPVLFSVPLRDNLTAARPDAAWPEVLAACSAAGVDLFVEELPDGYDTLIGERGVNLSGGQRQRVALARALVSEARVIVLDDPMSAVDTETERSIVTALRPALAGRTALIASQRLSTIMLADRAVVLVNGAVVEDGAPHDLLGRGGAFAALFGDEALVAA